MYANTYVSGILGGRGVQANHMYFPFSWWLALSAFQLVECVHRVLVNFHFYLVELFP